MPKWAEMQWLKVDSKTLASVAYDETKLTLELEFRSGERYRYSRVPLELYRQLMNADSKGAFFNSHIRDQFPTEHLAKARSANRSS